MTRYDDDSSVLDRKVPFKTALFLSCAVPAAFAGLLGLSVGSALPYAAMAGILGPSIVTVAHLPEIIKNFKKKQILKEQNEREVRIKKWRNYQQQRQPVRDWYNTPVTPQKSTSKQDDNPNYDIWAAGGRYFGGREDR